MIKIKELAKAIRKELQCAEHCTHHAMQYKEEDKIVGDLFYQLALDHLNNVDRIHTVVISIIKSLDTAKIPTVMKSIWDFEHELMLEEQSEIKACLDKYKQ